MAFKFKVRPVPKGRGTALPSMDTAPEMGLVVVQSLLSVEVLKQKLDC